MQLPHRPGHVRQVSLYVKMVFSIIRKMLVAPHNPSITIVDAYVLDDVQLPMLFFLFLTIEQHLAAIPSTGSFGL